MKIICTVNRYPKPKAKTQSVDKLQHGTKFSNYSRFFTRAAASCVRQAYAFTIRVKFSAQIKKKKKENKKKKLNLLLPYWRMNEQVR